MTQPTLRRALAGVALLSLALLPACAPGGGVESSRHPAEAPISFLPPPSPVMVALDNATELAITDAQRATLLEIRRGLDSANAPLRVRLDSLRPSQRPVNPRDLSPDQREAIRVRRAAVDSVMAQWKAHEDAVRPRTLALLTADQQKRVLELEEDARKRNDERVRREWESGERGGRYGRP